ncbi:hypothetical protein WR25_22704 [Diploscapter pachys]|uniref:Bestrophin homolog n=1 Tax=Diploscapter pachys TaxID=2018661 RepID=A0A2A2M0Q2_9BILA|nr:hypothetical protein WR25_22704 [Diploscapter pachys]
MLGFFVTIVVGRWSDIFQNIGWVDTTALFIATYVRGTDEKSRILRRNILRYMVLTQVLIFRDISMQVRRRFPTLETVVASGIMQDAEKDKYNDTALKYNKYFVPIQWCYSLLYEARTQGKISADVMLNEIMKQIGDYRKGLGQLVNYDWVPIPLVYPQVVFLAVRIYFLLAIIGRQSVLIDGEPPKDPNPIFPLVPFLMTALQFIFYESIWRFVLTPGPSTWSFHSPARTPVAKDDNDFEMNFLIDRNLAVGLMIVDECYNDAPPQSKDLFWNSHQRDPLYSAETAAIAKNEQIGSAANYEPKANEILMMPHVDNSDAEEDAVDDGEGAKLLSRGISVVSVNHAVAGSTRSLANKNAGVLATLKKQFSKGGTSDARSRLSRPNKLYSNQSSMLSINTDNRGVDSLTGANSVDILDELANEAKSSSIAQGMCTPSDNMSEVMAPLSPRRTTPSGGDMLLTSLEEEDEDNQKTLRSIELKKLAEQLKEEQAKAAEKKNQDSQNKGEDKHDGKK